MSGPNKPDYAYDDKLDEALDETFPASDPIEWDPKHGEPAKQDDQTAVTGR